MGIYTRLHPTITEHTFSSSSHATFPKTDHIQTRKHTLTRSKECISSRYSLYYDEITHSIWKIPKYLKTNTLLTHESKNPREKFKNSFHGLTMKKQPIKIVGCALAGWLSG